MMYIHLINICDLNEISFRSLSLYNDGRAYKLHVSVNITHSDRCLNIGSMFFRCIFHHNQGT